MSFFYRINIYLLIYLYVYFNFNKYVLPIEKPLLIRTLKILSVRTAVESEISAEYFQSVFLLIGKQLKE